MTADNPDQISFPFHNFIKRERDFHLLFFLLIGFLLGVYVLSPILQPFFSMLIPIFVAFYIVIFSTDYALFRSRFVEIDNALKAVFNEMVENRKRVGGVFQQLPILEDLWIKQEEGHWIYEKIPIRNIYSMKTKFFYQYLSNNAFTVLQSHNLDQIIKGAKIKTEPNYYHQITRFYLHCIKTSETTQVIEDEINKKIKTIKNNLCKSQIINKDHQSNNSFIRPLPVDGSGNYIDTYQIDIDIESTKFATASVEDDIDPSYFKKSTTVDINSNGINSEDINDAWENFILENVKIITDCFNLFQKNDMKHCQDLRIIDKYSDFFSTVIDQDAIFPTPFFSQIIGKWKKWTYLLLISSFIAIWGTVFLITGFEYFLVFLLSGRQCKESVVKL